MTWVARRRFEPHPRARLHSILSLLNPCLYLSFFLVFSFAYLVKVRLLGVLKLNLFVFLLHLCKSFHSFISLLISYSFFRTLEEIRLLGALMHNPLAFSRLSTRTSDFLSLFIKTYILIFFHFILIYSIKNSSVSLCYDLTHERTFINFYFHPFESFLLNICSSLGDFTKIRPYFHPSYTKELSFLSTLIIFFHLYSFSVFSRKTGFLGELNDESCVSELRNGKWVVTVFLLNMMKFTFLV